MTLTSVVSRLFYCTCLCVCISVWCVNVVCFGYNRRLCYVM